MDVLLAEPGSVMEFNWRKSRCASGIWGKREFLFSFLYSPLFLLPDVFLLSPSLVDANTGSFMVKISA